MSLGGLVVALGVVVDDAVIDVENITRRRRGARADASMRTLLLGASLEVRRPVFYATAAVAVAFLPIADALGAAGRVLSPAGDLLPARGRAVAAGGDERDSGAMRAADAGYAPRAEPRWLRRCKSWQQRAIARLAPHAKLVLAFCS